MNIHLKAILLIILTGIGVSICMYAQKENQYARIYKQISRLSTEELVHSGDTYATNNCADTALVYYIIAAERYAPGMSKSEKLLCINGCEKAGTIYYFQGNYTKALELYIRGFKLCESNGYIGRTPLFYKNIGNVYSVFSDFERGRNYYETGYKISHEYNDVEMKAKLLGNLTGVCSYMKNNEKAKEYYQIAKELKLKDGTIQSYFNFLNLGLIYANEKQYQKAIECFRKSADFAIEKGMEPRYKCSSYSELYKCYNQINNQDSVGYYLHLCYETAQKNKVMDVLSESLKALSEFYKQQKNEKVSLKYKSLFLTLADSIFNIREFSRIKNMQFLYEMEKINKEISDLNSEKETKERELQIQRRVLAGVALGLLIISVLLTIAYIQKKKLQNAYKDLFNRNNEIITSEKYNKELRIQIKEQQLSKQWHSTVDEQSEESTKENALNTKEKYYTSKLNDEQKEILIETINRIMETTYEFCNVDFTLESLASLANSNTKYVSQVINETYKKNFNIYINEYRIKEARIRLMNTAEYGNYTIKAIAESVGYKSHANFIVVFKKITGITPSIYQKMAKEQKIQE